MISKENPSKEYLEFIEAYKDLHTQDIKFLGGSLRPYIKSIDKLIKEYECKTLLDYGCGKAFPYSDKHLEVEIKAPVQKTWDIDSYTLYDPAYPKYDKLPTGKYDIVICTDVLEHIPEQDLDWVITRILNYSTKIVFINVCTALALKHFKKGKLKGKNFHISVFDENWWLQKFKKIWEKNKDIDLYLFLSDAKDNLYTYFKKKEK